MKKFLLFDMDDTLIDNVENVRYAFQVMTQYLGNVSHESDFQRWYQFDKQYWIDYHDHKVIVPERFLMDTDIFTKYLRSYRYQLFFNNNKPIEDYFIINELYVNALNEHVVPIPGAFETLEYLAKYYQIMIVTNGPSSAIPAKLAKINCSDFITNFFSADMTHNRITKSHEQFFVEMMTYFKFSSKEELLMIGDSFRDDVLGAKNFGIDAIWYNPKKEKNPSNLEIDEVHQLKELKRIL